jgi:MFS family permease
MSLQRNIRLLSWFNFFTDFKLYAPIAIIYFVTVTHSYALGASIFSITYIVSALFDVPTGMFADRIGRKKTVVLGAASAVVYAIFYAIGTNFWLLAVGAFFEGCSRALYSGNNNALIHNMLSDEGMEHDYHLYLGKLSSMFQIALAVSGLLGALIANWSFPLIMWLSVFPQLLCLLISFQITDRQMKDENVDTLIPSLQEGFRTFIRNSNLRLLSITSILDYGLGETAYQFQAAFYNTLLPIWAVGIAKTLSNIGAAIGFYYSGKVINKFGSFKILFLGTLYSKTINFVALIFPSALSPFLMSSNSFFYGTSSTAESMLMQKEFIEKQRATMSSINTFGGSLFFGVFAFITGLFADKMGPRYALLVIQFFSLLILWLRWKLIRLNKEKE